jgi:AraC family ethanolamine operon transcriptional activator
MIAGHIRETVRASANLRTAVAGSRTHNPVNGNGSGWEFTQLECSALHGMASMLRLDGVLVGNACVSHASLHRIKSPPGHLSIVLNGNRLSTMFVSGYRIAPNDCIVLDSNAEVEPVTHRHSDVVTMAVSLAALGADAHRLLSAGVPLRAGARLLRCTTCSIGALQGSIQVALQLRDAMPHPAPDEVLHRSLAASLVDHLRRISSALPAAQRREQLPRHKGVELARHYIHEHLADPIRLSDLCSCSHLRARTLEYGFHDILCITPIHYVKVLRLNQVHHQLLSPAYAGHSISALALDAGFQHLGQFAVDYKRLFLECPSDTRRRVAKADARASCGKMIDVRHK